MHSDIDPAETKIWKTVADVYVYRTFKARRHADCAIRITNGIPSGRGAFRRHDSCTGGGERRWIGLTGADRAAVGGKDG